MHTNSPSRCPTGTPDHPWYSSRVPSAWVGSDRIWTHGASRGLGRTAQPSGHSGAPLSPSPGVEPVPPIRVVPRGRPVLCGFPRESLSSPGCRRRVTPKTTDSTPDDRTIGLPGPPVPCPFTPGGPSVAVGGTGFMHLDTVLLEARERRGEHLSRVGSPRDVGVLCRVSRPGGAFPSKLSRGLPRPPFLSTPGVVRLVPPGAGSSRPPQCVHSGPLSTPEPVGIHRFRKGAQTPVTSPKGGAVPGPFLTPGSPNSYVGRGPGTPRSKIHLSGRWWKCLLRHPRDPRRGRPTTP